MHLLWEYEDSAVGMNLQRVFHGTKFHVDVFSRCLLRSRLHAITCCECAPAEMCPRLLMRDAYAIMQVLTIAVCHLEGLTETGDATLKQVAPAVQTMLERCTHHGAADAVAADVGRAAASELRDRLS